MPRISGVNIGDNQRLIAGLSRLYGIGPTLAAKIAESLGHNSNPKFSELSEAQIDKIRDLVEKQYLVEGDLRQIVAQNIRRLKEIGSYRGYRHTRGLPVNGQRTRTNARTKRGKRVTVGSGRKKSADKT
jgi:small subunit ribosomal protein S13